jgi:uncharacterized protein YyaL (SSP411 family)
MKPCRQTIATVAMTLLTAATALAQAGLTRGIPWIHSSAEALAAARQANAPILAFVTSSHCHFCQKMEAKTWSDDAVIRQVSSTFVPLRLDADREPKVVESLRIRGFPTTVIFTPEGKVIDSAEGYMPPAKLGILLERSATHHAEAAVFH